MGLRSFLSEAYEQTRRTFGLWKGAQSSGPQPVGLEKKLAEQHRKEDEAAGLQESLVDPLDMVDMREPFYDDGYQWIMPQVPGAGQPGQPTLTWHGFATELELFLAQTLCRRMATYSEFIVNGLSNRVNYTVSTGYKFTAVPKKSDEDEEADDEESSQEAEGQAIQAAKVLQAWLDDFLKRNRWGERQRETILRHDRDGEAIRRLFFRADGTTDVRFVEPWQVANPVGTSYSTDNTHFGIRHAVDDVETPEAYWIRQTPGGTDFEDVSADEINHLKCRADMNQPRGVPLFWVSRFNVRRAYKTLQNIAAKSEISAAIPFTRKHIGGTATSAAAFAGSLTTQSFTDPSSQQTVNKSKYGPASILDHSDRTEYEATNFAQGMDLMIEGLGQMLRAMAAAGEMPEFMFSVDASNNNFASALVSEGPVVRSFLALQGRLREADLWIIDQAIKHAVKAGRLPANILEVCDIQVGLPELATRDPDKEAAANKTYADMGIMSPQTLSEKLDLDYSQEQKNIETHREAGGTWPPVAALPAMPGMPSEPDESGEAKPDSAAAEKGALTGQASKAATVEELQAEIEAAYGRLTESGGVNKQE